MSNLDFHTQNYIQGGISVNQSLAEQERAKYKDNLFFLIVSFIALSLMLVIIVLNTYVFFIADVTQTSMYPTLQEGDKLFTNRYKEPEIDSIIIIKSKNGDLWVKRAIALGGSTVEIKEGLVYVDGKIKDEPYLKTYVTTEQKGTVSKWVLAEDEVFYLGDNRNGSYDARYDDVGPCKISDVVGVVEGWSLWLNGVRE